MATATQYSKAELENMTVDELKQVAEEEDIHVPSHATKAEIVKAIVNGTQADAKSNATPDAKMAAGDAPEITPLALTGAVNPLPLAGIVADAYGIGKKYNIQLTDIVGLGAALQGNILLDNLPAGSILQYVRIKHSQSVAGPSISACTAQVVDGTNSFGSAFDVFQAVANTAISTAQLTASNIGPFAAVYPIYLTLIATGANLSVATAGAISVWLRYFPLA